MSELTGLISDIQRFSLHDGPGIRTTIFLKGCPLSCRWCHNPELIGLSREVLFNSELCIQCFDCIDICMINALHRNNNLLTYDKSRCNGCGDCIPACPTSALFAVGREMSVEDVVDIVKRDIQFYEASCGGVTISGGEPMLQAGFVEALAGELQAENISVALDTCGFVPFHDYINVLKNTDIVLFDIKSVDNAKHLEYTGKSNELIMDNYRKIADSNVRVFVRIPLIPGFNDDINSVMDLAKFLSQCEKPEEIDILPFNTLTRGKYSSLGLEFRLDDSLLTPSKRIEEIFRILTEKGFKVVLYNK